MGININSKNTTINENSIPSAGKIAIGVGATALVLFGGKIGVKKICEKLAKSQTFINFIKRRNSQLNIDMDNSVYNKLSEMMNNKDIPTIEDAKISVVRKKKFDLKKEFEKDLNADYKQYCKDVLNEYRQIYPEKTFSNKDISGNKEKTTMLEHIGGYSSQVTEFSGFVDILNKKGKYFTLKTKNNDGKTLEYQSLTNTFTGDDKRLIQEYKSFLNNKAPTTSNFKEFLELKDLNHIKKNNIFLTDIFEMRKNKMLQDEKIADYIEKNNLYNKLFGLTAQEQADYITKKLNTAKTFKIEEINAAKK